jgi:hypothetical protein
MLKKEFEVFECAYCDRKYSNLEDCRKCEEKHEEQLRGEKDRFNTFLKELSEVEVKKHEKPIDSDLPILHCSKCLRLIHEDSYYVSAFNYILCLEDSVPIFKIFAKNYMNFKFQFSNKTVGVVNSPKVINHDQTLINNAEACACEECTSDMSGHLFSH